MEQFSIKMGEAGFAFSLMFLPLILGFFHAKLRNANKVEMIFLYYAFIGVGIQGLTTGAVQIFLPSFVAHYIDWPYSSFIFELGLANFSYGILGVLSPWLNRGWQSATIVGYGLFLFSTGIGHVVSIFQQGITPGNSGAFLLSDLFIPTVFFLLLASKK